MYSIRGKRILIIDDDEDINTLFTIFLEYDGYKNRCFY
jgi:DNA-binding response OmpR family regulator